NMQNPSLLPSYGILGNRNYELSDHRGNVQTVINDIKYPLESNGSITSYEVGITQVTDYSPFGVELDGRTIENNFYYPNSSVDTVNATIYALKETFESASNWEEMTIETQITYPTGKMQVKNSAGVRKKIGVKKEFTTGEGLHDVSFEIAYLPITLCPIIVTPGSFISSSQENDSILESEGFGVQGVQNPYLVFEIFDENLNSILKDSTRDVGTYFYDFSATEGKNYSIYFYVNSLCNSRYFQIDNVFISYKKDIIVDNTNAFADNHYRYSFQNQEKHDEIRGKGKYINYKYRGYDPRVGRLDWTVDPLAAKYPWYSPYQFSGNRVIHMIELEGLEATYTFDKRGNNTRNPGAPNFSDIQADEQFLLEQKTQNGDTYIFRYLDYWGKGEWKYTYNKDRNAWEMKHSSIQGTPNGKRYNDITGIVKGSLLNLHSEGGIEFDAGVNIVRVLYSEEIPFIESSYDLSDRNEANSIINRAADILLANPSSSITIYGNANVSHGQDWNSLITGMHGKTWDELSKDRIEVIKEMLIDRGVNESQINQERGSRDKISADFKIEE
ncbi:MAG: hypothetical protein H3C31_13880, partial [Brumimicrobium sp.]|nr:hypothetical protein [Brumimicrobium sp.]